MSGKMTYIPGTCACRDVANNLVTKERYEQLQKELDAIKVVENVKKNKKPKTTTKTSKSKNVSTTETQKVPDKNKNEIVSLNNITNINDTYIWLKTETEQIGGGRITNNISIVLTTPLTTKATLKQKTEFSQEPIPDPQHESITYFMSVSPAVISIQGVVAIRQFESYQIIEEEAMRKPHSFFESISMNANDKLHSVYENPFYKKLIGSGNVVNQAYQTLTPTFVRALIDRTSMIEEKLNTTTEELEAEEAKERLSEIEKEIEKQESGVSNPQLFVAFMHDAQKVGTLFNIRYAGILFENMVITDFQADRIPVEKNHISVNLNFMQTRIVGVEYKNNTAHNPLMSKLNNKGEINTTIKTT